MDHRAAEMAGSPSYSNHCPTFDAHGHHVPQQWNAEQVWVVEQEPALTGMFCRWLEFAGITYRSFSSNLELLAALQIGAPAVICVDLASPDGEPCPLVQRVRECCSSASIVLLTGPDSRVSDEHCLRIGAVAAVSKYCEREQFVDCVLGALDGAPSGACSDELLPGIIGRSYAMRSVYQQVRSVASNNISVHLRGETGTGKELIARAIHDQGKRRSRPFIALNCGAIVQSLQESELFGHERGAFTGATTAQQGVFERAQFGTIFLDEVGELTMATQVRLLRVLQERQLQRIGAKSSIGLDVRVISATHRSLERLVEEGKFREDLYYRLVVFPVELPRLCDRRDDVGELIEHFVAKYADDVGVGNIRIDPAFRGALESYDWPGNVRELENVVYGALVRSRSRGSDAVLDPACLTPQMRAAIAGRTWHSPGSSPGPVGGSAFSSVARVEPSAYSGSGRAPAHSGVQRSSRPIAANSDTWKDGDEDDIVPMDEVERRTIEAALACLDGNVTQAAKKLKIARATLYRKMERFAIDHSKYVRRGGKKNRDDDEDTGDGGSH